MMKKILAKASECSDNGFTTHITVKPNRHTMAIFMPNTLVLSTGIKTTVFHDFTPSKIMRIVGLITQNKRPFLGNMRSRLCAVVETQHHLFLNGKFTKHIGA